MSPEQLQDPARAARGVWAGGEVPALQRAHHLKTMARESILYCDENTLLLVESA